MTTVQIFHQITDILTYCANQLYDGMPKGNSSFVSAKAAPIVNKFSDKLLTLQVQTYRKIQDELRAAHKLMEDLGSRLSQNIPFSEEGLDELYDDIDDVNKSGRRIHTYTTRVLRCLVKGAPEYDLVLSAYNQAVRIYQDLSDFTNKAQPEGSLQEIDSDGHLQSKVKPIPPLT